MSQLSSFRHRSSFLVLGSKGSSSREAPMISNSPNNYEPNKSSSAETHCCYRMRLSHPYVFINFLCPNVAIAAFDHHVGPPTEHTKDATRTEAHKHE